MCVCENISENNYSTQVIKLGLDVRSFKRLSNCEYDFDWIFLHFT